MAKALTGMERYARVRKYGVIIVTYNRLALLKQCLKHVLFQSYQVSEVIIVDNASNDGTTEYLKSLSDKSDTGAKLTIEYNEYNKGGAGGFADGVRKAVDTEGLDYVLLIDDDALIDKDYIKNIDNAVNSNPKVKAFSGTVMVNGSIDTSHRRRIKSRLMAAFSDVAEAEYGGNGFFYDQTSFCGIVIECGVMRSIGLPLEDYFIRYDDTEYSFRLRKLTRILNVNNALIDHRTSLPDKKRVIDAKLYYDVRNRMDMAGRHLGRLAVVILYLRAVIKIMLCCIMGVTCSITGKRKSADSLKCERRLYSAALEDFRGNRLGKREKF